MKNHNMKDRAIDNDIQDVIKQGEERVKSVISDVQKQIKQGQEKVKKTATAVDKQLHENPWPIVAGVAIGGLLLGFLMGASKKK